MLPMYFRRPLSRLEMGLYAVIVAVAAAMLLDRLLAAMELAERASMEATITRVNAALNVRITYLMLDGQLVYVQAALKKNPFDLVKGAPPSYRGEGDTADLARLDSGSWFFDRERTELVYKPWLKRNLVTGDGSELVRFHLVAAPGTRYVLVPANKYQWD